MRKPVRYGENLNKATGDVYTCIYIFLKIRSINTIIPIKV